MRSGICHSGKRMFTFTVSAGSGRGAGFTRRFGGCRNGRDGPKGQRFRRLEPPVDYPAMLAHGFARHKQAPVTAHTLHRFVTVLFGNGCILADTNITL